MSEDNVLERRKRDFDDYNHEIAGVDVGRLKRFLTGERSMPEIERKKREARAFHTMLMQLMADPVYRAKHEAVMDVLRNAAQATETALDQLQRALDTIQETLDDMDANAARLPDHTLVFRDANGVVRRANGSVVDDDLAATILWTGREPSYEAYTAQQAQRDEVEASLTAVRGYQNDVLGPARDRITDPDTPPSLKELDDIGSRITATMPEAVQARLPESDTELTDTGLSMNVALPTLGAEP